jgi:peptide/nickel transport system permease protein
MAVAGLALVLIIAVAALLAPLLSPHDPAQQNRLGLSPRGEPLGLGAGGFPLGTDGSGRDVLSRLLYGARTSLAVGVASNLLAAALGTAIGALAALGGRWRQAILMRSVDVVLSFPTLLLAVAVVAVTKPSMLTIIPIIGVAFAAYLSRLVFTQVIAVAQRDFVVAARTMGVRGPALFFRHVLPHVLPTVVVFSTLAISTAIQLEAALSYVGIGIQPPGTSLGSMLSDGQGYLLVDPRLVILPAAVIVTAMVAFSLLGDGLRDALDPTLEARPRLRGLR